MNALARDLAGEIPIRTRSTVTAVRRADGGDSLRWTVTVTSDGDETDEGPFDAVIFAAPPPQWSHLLAKPPSFAETLRSVEFLPTWAVMLGFSEPLPIPADGLFVHDEMLSWAARNSSKPERGASESWVLHANPAWARGREEMPPDEVRQLLVGAFRRVAGAAIPDPVHAAAHRWRLSRSEPALGVDAFWDRHLRIGACGDWCIGSRIEGAYLSGVGIAEYVIGS
jgi:predicted NAD/FAD-dependent oxidoreductase